LPLHLVNIHLVNIHLINVTSNVYSTSAMTKHSTDKQLRRLYRENWDVFTKAIEAGTSAPLLLSASETYREADQRLFFVGQETAGWDRPSDTDDRVGKLMKRYRAFRFGEDGLRHTPFWRAVHEVREEVNPESSDASILWSNLSKVDSGGEPPSEEILGPLLEAEILTREIEITCPDAVVFFTGPTGRYDRLLRRTFRGVGLTEVESKTHLHDVTCPALPEQSFRTYHPRYLQQDKQWDLLETLSTQLKEN
jgi:hypothetical protein